MLKKFKEPAGSFPYRPPNEKILKKFEYLKNNNIKIKWTKRCFDIVGSILLMFLFLPIVILIVLGFMIESSVSPEARGPILYFYWAMSKNKKIKKWKFRQFKMKYVNKEFFNKKDWRAFSTEWDSRSLTNIGKLIKRYYLDEIPQLYSIFKGDMSFVGPRPLAVHHYERDLKQGNFTRALLHGGLLGLGHVRKGYDDFGDPTYEFEYLRIIAEEGALKIFLTDIRVIYLGILTVIKGGGH